MSPISDEQRAEFRRIAKEAVADWPPLTPEQQIEIRRVLGPLQYPQPVQQSQRDGGEPST